jgi:hypothetical protein
MRSIHLNVGGEDSLGALPEAITRGLCGGGALESLAVNSMGDCQGRVEELLGALGYNPGTSRSLRSLVVVSDNEAEDCLCLARFAELVGGGAFPSLQKLRFSWGLSTGPIEAFAGALAGGGLPRLRELVVSGPMSKACEGLAPVVEALLAGACPQLRVLGMYNVTYDERTARALAAVAAGQAACAPSLRVLRLLRFPLSAEGLGGLLGGLALPGGLRLTELSLELAQGAGDGMSVLEALRGPAGERLGKLQVHGLVGAQKRRFLERLAEALEGGAMLRLASDDLLDQELGRDVEERLRAQLDLRKRRWAT